MPNIVLPIPDTYSGITRPIVLSVIRALDFITEISPDTPVYFNGANNIGAQFNSTTGALTSFDSAKFNHLQKVKITVTESPEESDLLTQRVLQHDALFCFWDEALRVEAKPVYSKTEYVVEFEFRGADRQAAETWKNSMRARIAMGRAEHTHQADYEYGMPYEYFLILKEIWRLRENQAGYGQTFKQWFDACLPQHKATILTKADGTEPYLVFKETQMNFLGAFDFTGVPQADRDGEGATWKTTFSYKFHVDKPTNMVLKYPQIIHNQLLDEKWRGNNTDASYARMIADRSHHQRGYDFMRQLNNWYFGRFEGIRIPYFDDWIPLRTQPDYTQLFQCAVCIDPDQPTQIWNLSQFEDFFAELKLEWTDSFLAFLKLQGMRLFTRTQSIFLVTVTEDQVLLGPGLLQLDNDLNVSTTSPRDLRKTYHLQVYLLHDLTKLSKQATDELVNHPEICIPILTALKPDLNPLPKVVGGRLVNRNDYLTAIGQVITSNKKYTKGGQLLRLNVGCFTVVTHKEEGHERI